VEDTHAAETQKGSFPNYISFAVHCALDKINDRMLPFQFYLFCALQYTSAGILSKPPQDSNQKECFRDN
jgi:hypothetical protein